jgi:hypothetical protein
MATQEHRHLGQEIKETNAFNGRSLTLATLSSVVSAAIIPVLGAGQFETLGGAALSPLVVAVFTTRGGGLVRGAGVAALSAIALVITIGGFTVPEALAGRGSLTAAGAGTFVSTERKPTPTPTEPVPTETTTKPPKKSTPPPKTPKPQGGMEFEVPASRVCPEVLVGESEACRQIGVKNVGTTTIELTTEGLAGEQTDDFVLTKVCNGTLKPGTACSVRLRFRPTTTGLRGAEVVVHLNPGGITRRIKVSGTALDNNPSPGTPTPTDPAPPTETP